jgi:hypothetical protein
MRMILQAALSTLLLAGCGRTGELSAPAPAGALQCAVEAAEQMGYERITGGAARGAIRVSQRLEPAPAQAADPQDLLGLDEIRPVVRNPQVENQLVLREAGGRLRIEVLGVNREGREIRGGADADDHARIILVQCSAPSDD